MNPSSSRIWTISNGLSLLRVLLVAPVVLLLGSSSDAGRVVLVLCIVFAALTDLLDGWLARKFGQVTELGKIIDPLADKISVGIVGAALALTGRIPPWYIFLVVGRDMVILAGGVYIRQRLRFTLQSTTLGKWAVTSVAVYILFVAMLRDQVLYVDGIFLFLSTLMLILSFVVYARRFFSIISGAAYPASSATPRVGTR